MKNIIALILSSGYSQLIPLVISPILTRLYSQEEFGRFALYTAIITILSVIVTARYEQAINLPKKNRDAIHIAVLALIFCISISFLILLIIFFCSNYFAIYFSEEEISKWLYLIPLSTLTIGVYQILYYWENRKANYMRIALSRTLQSSTSGAGQVGAGINGLGIGGLIAGQLLAQILTVIFIIRLSYGENKKLLKNIKINKVIIAAKKYRDFPRFMILGHLLNNASGYMPLFVLGSLYGPEVAGFYSLAQRVTITPLSLIGGAIGDIYRSEASKHYREFGNCLKIFKYTIVRLTFISLVVSMPIFIWGVEIFAMIFGSNWSHAGEIASLLAVMILFQGISSPTSETVLLGGLLKLDLAWQLLRLFLSISSLFLGFKISPDNPNVSILMFGLSFSLLYLLHLFLQYKVARGDLFYSKK